MCAGDGFHLETRPLRSGGAPRPWAAVATPGRLGDLEKGAEEGRLVLKYLETLARQAWHEGKLTVMVRTTPAPPRQAGPGPTP